MRILDRLRAYLGVRFGFLSNTVIRGTMPTLNEYPVLVVTEGTNDAEFLRRLSAILHRDEPAVPDLAAMELLGELIFVPAGGDPRTWCLRFAGMGRPEYHLYDRESPPETAHRLMAAAIVNQRPNCRAQITSKRALENYLHPLAVSEALGIEVTFGDQDPVADLVAQQVFQLEERLVDWNDLPPRSRKRRRERAKKRLNREAVSRMNAQRLAERDPQHEVRGWLVDIARLAEDSR